MGALFCGAFRRSIELALPHRNEAFPRFGRSQVGSAAGDGLLVALWPMVLLKSCWKPLNAFRESVDSKLDSFEYDSHAEDDVRTLAVSPVGLLDLHEPVWFHGRGGGLEILSCCC